MLRISLSQSSIVPPESPLSTTDETSDTVENTTDIASAMVMQARYSWRRSDENSSDLK